MCVWNEILTVFSTLHRERHLLVKILHLCPHCVLNRLLHTYTTVSPITVFWSTYILWVSLSVSIYWTPIHLGFTPPFFQLSNFEYLVWYTLEIYSGPLAIVGCL